MAMLADGAVGVVDRGQAFIERHRSRRVKPDPVAGFGRGVELDAEGAGRCGAALIRGV